MSLLDSKRFKALGQDWTARFDFNCAIELEENDPQARSFMEMVSPFLMRLDEKDRTDPAKALAAAKAIKFGDIRMILTEALREAHPDITENMVGKICAAIGVGKATEIVAWAVVQALPATEDEADGGDEGGATSDANPPKKPNRKARRAAAVTG